MHNLNLLCANMGNLQSNKLLIENLLHVETYWVMMTGGDLLLVETYCIRTDGNVLLVETYCMKLMETYY